jgi:hypothetical protein
MPSKAEVSYPTATQQDDGFPLDQSRVASAGPLVEEERRGDRATATFEDICNRAIAVKFYAGRYTKAARDGTVYSRAMSPWSNCEDLQSIARLVRAFRGSTLAWGRDHVFWRFDL